MSRTAVLSDYHRGNNSFQAHSCIPPECYPREGSIRPHSGPNNDIKGGPHLVDNNTQLPLRPLLLKSFSVNGVMFRRFSLFSPRWYVLIRRKFLRHVRKGFSYAS
jgi:hypothetical protein